MLILRCCCSQVPIYTSGRVYSPATFKVSKYLQLTVVHPDGTQQNLRPSLCSQLSYNAAVNFRYAFSTHCILNWLLLRTAFLTPNNVCQTFYILVTLWIYRYENILENFQKNWLSRAQLAYFLRNPKFARSILSKIWKRWKLNPLSLVIELLLINYPRIMISQSWPVTWLHPFYARHLCTFALKYPQVAWELYGDCKINNVMI